MVSKVQISLVIPVYNQEKNISISLARIKKVLDSCLISYEIVIVDDGSIDNTLQILKAEQASDPRVRLVSYDQNRGKGHAVKTGILESKGSVVMFTDGDLDISPDSIRDYVKELEMCDLVIASKRHPLSKVHSTFSRKFLSRAFNLLVRISVGIRVKDTQSGLKAGNGDVLRTIFRVMLVRRYAFDVELLAIATALGLTIKELPVQLTLDRRFKVRDIARMFVDVAGISYRFRVKRWYQKQLRELSLTR